MFGTGTEAIALLRAQQLNGLYRIIPRCEVKWEKKQAHHRNYPQPKQAFIDTIVVLG
jgi:hypothetical protein